MELDVKKIVDSFGLELVDYVKVRAVYMCNTKTGVRSLKESSLPKDRLLFQYYAKEHLHKNGFHNTDRFEINKVTNLPYYEEDNKVYIMTYWISGRECELENPIEMELAVRTLANLHIASMGFVMPDGAKTKDDLGKIPEMYQKRRSELVRFKNKIERQVTKNDFDKGFISNIKEFIQKADEAILTLQKSKYYELVNATRRDNSFCHHDYAFHNIIINDDNEVSVIDFDYSCYEIRVYDLANIIKRHMRKCFWDIEEAKKIVEIYHSVNRLNREELMVLKAILTFPQKFWRIVNRYYNSKRNWENGTFLSKLQNEIEQKDSHTEFIRNYDMRILNVVECV